MVPAKEVFKRDLFEIDNARNLSREELVATFVPTKNFWRLLSAKNHIVLGSRGSGKTALAKMLSHDHLARLDNERARKAIQARSFIGIYVPMRTEWVGALKNKPWQNEREAELFFQWRLNIATCYGFLDALESCLEQYVPDVGDRARAERDVCQGISIGWSGGREQRLSVRLLREYLEDIEYDQQQFIAYRRVFGAMRDQTDWKGLPFHADLFTPLRRAITLACRAFEFPTECAWLLCLDEAEFLEPFHHRILNSYLRGHSGNVNFKITTMPYRHHTLDTNTGVPLNVGHDFEYVYIDQDPILSAATQGDEGKTFATTLFNKRARASGARYRRLARTTTFITLGELLGRSELLTAEDSTWAPGSRLLQAFVEYASPDTIDRAHRLGIGSQAFMDQIGRKIRPALILREKLLAQRGRGELDIYSGDLMAIRLGDANPRRLIRIFNSLLLEVPSTAASHRKRTPLLSRKHQTRILIRFASAALSRVQSESEVGRELFRFIRSIGYCMQNSLIGRPLTTDQISSIMLSDETSDDIWGLVQAAVGLALLYPNISTNNPDELPEKSGSFHFAYVLAPLFRILPRRGKSRSVETVVQQGSALRARLRETGVLQQELFSDEE